MVDVGGAVAVCVGRVVEDEDVVDVESPGSCGFIFSTCHYKF